MITSNIPEIYFVSLSENTLLAMRVMQVWPRKLLFRSVACHPVEKGWTCFKWLSPFFS